MEQLSGHKGAAESEIESIVTQRQDLRKELRRLTRKGDQPAADEVRGQIGQLSRQLKKLRKEIVLCESIVSRSKQVKDNLDHLLLQEAAERKARTVQKRNRDFNVER